MRGAFNATSREDHIHLLEYEAVYQALLGLGNELQDCCIRLWCDNMVVVAGLTKEFSQKPAIITHIRRILGLL